MDHPQRDEGNGGGGLGRQFGDLLAKSARARSCLISRFSIYMHILGCTATVQYTFTKQAPGLDCGFNCNTIAELVGRESLARSGPLVATQLVVASMGEDLLRTRQRRAARSRFGSPCFPFRVLASRPRIVGLHCTQGTRDRI